MAKKHSEEVVVSRILLSELTFSMLSIIFLNIASVQPIYLLIGITIFDLGICLPLLERIKNKLSSPFVKSSVFFSSDILMKAKYL